LGLVDAYVISDDENDFPNLFLLAVSVVLLVFVEGDGDIDASCGCPGGVDGEPVCGVLAYTVMKVDNCQDIPKSSANSVLRICSSMEYGTEAKPRLTVGVSGDGVSMMSPFQSRRSKSRKPR